MRVLLIGGTGLISVGILKALQARGTDLAMINRGQTTAKAAEPLPKGITTFQADRRDVEAMKTVVGTERFDVVIDMVAFTEAEAKGGMELARHVGATQLIFCSTVCTYGIDIPPHVLVDEAFEQNPVSDYGRGKVAAEQRLLGEHDRGDVAVTIVRPSHTYGEGGPLICQLEFDTPTWSRLAAGKPVMLAGDGLGLWNSTHRDDVGELFARVCLNEVTFGQAYNATTNETQTWNDYYRRVAGVIGKPADLVYAPRDWIVAFDPDRFGLLREITGFHGTYDSGKARRDLDWACKVSFEDGVQRTLNDIARRSAAKPADDTLLDEMLTAAESAALPNCRL